MGTAGKGKGKMTKKVRLAVLETTFFFLLASIIMFSLIGWRQLALFLSAIVAVAGRMALDYYNECLDGCRSLSAKVSLLPTITLVAVALTMISFHQHPFLMAALFTLLFVLVIWKIAMLLNWTCHGGKERQG